MPIRNQNVAAAPQPQQNRVLPAPGRQKAAMAGRPETKPLRAVLRDVGNIRGKQQLGGGGEEPVNAHRPVTRNFGAQLISQAQEKAKARLPRFNLAPPPPAHFDVISSDSDTLTSVLSARSKYAARDVIQDIDKLDGDNELAVVDYIEDIYTFYKVAENECRPCDYIDSQVELNSKMRGVLVNWIIEVHQKFDLMPESLYLTVYIIDQFLSMQPVRVRELQLLGVSALLIACKYEEIWAPKVDDFVFISDSAYTRDHILRMEKAILNRLQWNLTVPTLYVFLVRFAKAASYSDSNNDKEINHMVFYFAELALMQYSLVLSKPSMVAAAAVYAARFTLKRTPLWTDTLKHHTGFTDSQLVDCAKILVTSHSTAPQSKLQVVHNKYSSKQLGRVALRPAATEICK